MTSTAKRLSIYLGISVLYFIAAKIGLDLATLNKSASPVWPASGIAVGLLFALGTQYWPAILLGAFAANLLTQSPLLSTFFIALGNTGEALAGAFIARWVARQKLRGSQFEVALSFFSAATFSPLISATMGTLSLFLTNALTKEAFAGVWSTWWVGDALGILSVGPLTWTIIQSFRPFRTISPKSFLADASVVVLTAVLATFSLQSIPGNPIVFLTFLPLVFGVSRVNEMRVFILSGLCMAIGVWHTLHGRGPFVGGTTNQNLIFLQLFLSSFSISALLLHCLVKTGSFRLGRVVLTASWLFAAFMYHSFSQQELAKDHSRLQGLVNERMSAIQSRIESYEESLRSAAAFYASSVSVEAHEWKSFVHSISITERLPGILGLGIIWRVPPRQKGEFFADLRKQNVPYKFQAVPNHSLEGLSEFFVIKYVEPMATNQAVLGVAINSEVKRREAAEQARDSGLSTVTEPIVLIQDKENLPGFLFYLPLYKNGTSIATVSDRQKNLIGWVFAPMTWKGLLEGVLGQTHSEIDFEVLTTSPNGQTTRLFDTNAEDNLANAHFEVTTALHFGQKEYRFVWNRGPEFISSHDTIVAWIGFVSTIIGLLIASILTILQSITHRVQSLADQAIADLRASEEKFEAIIRNVKDYAILMLDPGGFVVTWNEGARLIKGYEASEILGKHFSLFYPPRDRESHVPETVLQAARGGSYSQEGWRIRKNGEIFWANVAITPIVNGQGKLVGFAKVVRDLTALKKAENERNQLISILDASPDFIGIADMQGHLRYHNPAAKKMVGLPSDVDLSTMRIKDMHPEWAATLVGTEGVPKVLKGGPWKKETALLHRDGHEIPVSQVLMLHRGPDGEPEYLSTIMRDITEDKQRSQQEALAQKIDRFLANAENEADVLRFVGKTIAQHLKWEVSIFWKLGNDDILQFQDGYATDQNGFKTFVEGSRDFAYEKGKDLPGKALEVKDLVWMEGIAKNPHFSRKGLAEKAQLRSGFSFPVYLGEQVFGCFEFLTQKETAEDPRLADLFRDLQKGISQRIQYLRSKLESDQRLLILQSVIDGYPGPVQVKDLEGRYQLLNQSVADLFGLPKEKLLGSTLKGSIFEEYAEKTLAEDLEVAHSGAKLIERSLEVKGKNRDYFIHKFPLRNLAGEVHAICAITTDVTEQNTLRQELKQSARRLEFALEGSSDGMWDWDLIRKEIYVSDKFAKLFGIPQIVPLRDEADFAAVVHPEEVQQTIESLRRHLSGQSPIHEVEARLRIASGEYRWMLTRGKVSERDSSGKPIRMTGVHIDIEKMKRTQKDLKLAEIQALEAVKAKAHFLASMSHEIRTPLNGVIGMTELLLETKLAVRQKEYAEIIQQSGTSLLALVNDILDFSKIEAGKMTLEKTDFSIAQVLEGQTEILLAKARQKNLSISTFVSPHLPSPLKGDPGRLGQILLNLVGNALKFTHQGGVSIRAQEMENLVSKDAIWVRFEVEDTGIGLSEAAKTRLFQPFSQGDESVSRKYGGTGLGLSICKRLVDAMDGRIGIESREGMGSTFWFEIPLQYAEKMTTLDSESDTLAHMRILVLESDPLSREAIRRYVSSWQMEIQIAESTIDALRILNAASKTGQPYRLVLIGSPQVKDSLEIIRKIKKGLKKKKGATFDLDFLLALDFGQEITRDRLKKSGFTALIPKPARQSQLFDCLMNTVTTTTRTSNVTEISKTILNPSDRRQFRILLADDVAANQLLARRMLEGLGYAVTVAGNGLEVLSLLDQVHCDLILMDCQMPEMDGFEATQRIRSLSDARKKAIPIIALTANALAGDDKKCIAAGMNDYLAKPIKKDILQAKLDQWLSAIHALKKEAA